MVPRVKAEDDGGGGDVSAKLAPSRRSLHQPGTSTILVAAAVAQIPAAASIPLAFAA
jgi:hypothetical protein